MEDFAAVLSVILASINRTRFLPNEILDIMIRRKLPIRLSLLALRMALQLLSWLLDPISVTKNNAFKVTSTQSNLDQATLNPLEIDLVSTSHFVFI